MSPEEGEGWLPYEELAHRAVPLVIGGERVPSRLEIVEAVHAAIREAVAEKDEALRKIGRLTRWVGWMEARKETGAEDMRKIQEIAEDATGLSFEEKT